jgi:hypothetical protein
VERKNYQGLFLPGFKASVEPLANVLAKLPNPNLSFIDHCVGNQPDLQVYIYFKNLLYDLKTCSINCLYIDGICSNMVREGSPFPQVFFVCFPPIPFLENKSLLY